MKTLQTILLSFSFVLCSTVSFAQEKTEKIAVSGECGMCKSKIEKAAKTAGASFASWDVDAKELTVKYASGATNAAKIEQAVAAVGYDTKNVKATDEAYSKLHSCCKYERAAAAASTDAKAHNCGDSCEHGKCKDHTACKKDGKCDKDMNCCKDGKCEQDCCKKA